MLSCTTCQKDFKTGASLNFHNKKVHGGDSKGRDSCERNSEVAMEEPRRSQRKRGAPIRFGKLNIPDYTTGPFKMSQVYLKITEEAKKKQLNAPKLEKAKRSPAEVLKVKVDQATATNLTKNSLKRKVIEDDITTSVNETEELPTPLLPCFPSLTPNESFPESTAPLMPVLTPQVSPSTSNSDNSINGIKRPKRNKFGKHWKYHTDEAEDVVLSQSDPVETAESTVNGTVSPMKQNSELEPKTSATIAVSGIASQYMQEKGKHLSKKSDDDAQSYVSTLSGSDRSQTTSDDSANEKKRGRQPNACPVCKKTDFRNLNHYNNHLEIHEGKRPFLCPNCDMGYETDMKLLEHVSIRHSQEALFPCLKCGTNYKTHRGLENHRCS